MKKIQVIGRRGVKGLGPVKLDFLPERKAKIGLEGGDENR